MINLIFNKDFKKYINISLFKNNQFFSNKKYKSYYTFDKVSFFEAISYILDNSYVVFSNYVLKQDRGIPMGGNSSSEIADCSLAWYEFIYMKSLMEKKNRSKLQLAKTLSNNKRYVDDLISLNYAHFGDLYKNIYPDGLLMERSGNDNRVVNYLDVRLEFDGIGNYTTTVYNKLDDFDFQIIQYTFSSGNMPHEIGHNIFYSEILRFAQLTSERKNFVTKVKRLYDMLVGRGYQKSSLIKKFRRVMGKHCHILTKYNVCDVKVMEDKIF